jgi:hypothetical protein
MEAKQRIEIKSNNFLPYSESSLKIGNTKISLSKENQYTIESTGLLLDSINENLMHSHGYGHGTNNTHVNRRVKTISTSSINGKQLKTNPKTKKELYEKIKIEFNAETVMPLTTFLNKQTNKNGTDYNVILHFIGNIGNQLTFLRNRGYSIPFFSLEDFIVIDNSVFSFMNDEKLFKVDNQTKNITIDFPMTYNKNNSFIPPHVAMGLDNDPDKIPLDVYFSSIYYSLAQICVYIFIRERIKDEEDYDKVSGPFIYTSLYWCLKRCLDKDENKRILLYV